MNRLVLAIALISLTIIVGVASLFVISNAEKNMVVELDSVLKYAREENPDLLNKSIERATKQWEKETPLLNILIGQQETNQIMHDLRMIERFAREGDKSTLILYVCECKTDLEKIRITNEPSLSTIL